MYHITHKKAQHRGKRAGLWTDNTINITRGHFTKSDAFANFTLAPDQAEAISQIADWIASGQIAFALSGPAGTGKSYALAALVQTRRNIVLTATTHKAAKVLADLMPDACPRTVHSVLGLRPVPNLNNGRLILRQEGAPQVRFGELLVVDEASMVDSQLLERILAHAKRIGFKVLFVGDSYQLPPVGEATSPVFGALPTVNLTEVKRQAAENPLLAVATQVRAAMDGQPFPYLDGCDRGLVRAEGEGFIGALCEEFAGVDYADDPDHCRALAWTNARVIELNAMIRRHLIGHDADKWPLIPGETFIVNEPIIEGDTVLFPTEARVQVQSATFDALEDTETGIIVPGFQVEIANDGNDGEVFVPTSREAAMALLKAVKSKADGLQRITNQSRGFADFGLDQERRAAWRRYFAIKEKLADLRPPHACTIHKAQGSTFHRAFIDLADIGRANQPGTIARLAYVALTRPRETAIVTGELPSGLYLRAAA